MSLCDQCIRLTLAPMRNDVPFHLHTSDAPTAHITAAPKPRVFECEVCDARWNWKNVTGWYLKAPNCSSDTDEGGEC